VVGLPPRLEVENWSEKFKLSSVLDVLLLLTVVITNVLLGRLYSHAAGFALPPS